MSGSTNNHIAGEVSAAAAVKANYLKEVCTEVLKDTRFSTELESSRFFHTAAASILEHEASKTFSDKLESLLNGLFKNTLNLSKLWPQFNKLAVGDTLKLDWKEFCDQLDVEMKPLFYQYITEEVFKKMLREKVKKGAQEEAAK